MSVTEIKEVLQNCMDRAVDENEMAGCTFCLIRNGEEKLYLESGYADHLIKHLFILCAYFF